MVTGEPGSDKVNPSPLSEREKWEFEKWEKREELKLKEGELKLKEDELNSKKKEQERFEKELLHKIDEAKRSRWSSPLVLAILAVAGAVLSGVANSYFTAAGNQRVEEQKAKFAEHIEEKKAELAEHKAESDRLQAMLAVADQRAAKNNLEFMIAAKLIHDSDVIAGVQNYLALKATTEFPVLLPPTNLRPICDSAGSPLPEPVPRMNGDLLNLALLPEATASASSVYPDPLGARHSIEYLHDGWYNNCRSWVSNAPTAWVEIDLKKDYKISMVAFGSEHTAFYRDRAVSKFTLLGSKSEAPDRWVVLKQYDGSTPISDRQEFRFDEQPLRKIKIDIKESIRGEPRIDELEIYGRPL